MQSAPSSTLLLQAAAAAAGDQHFPAPALYVVATPIGNLADIGLRALHVLALVDAVACEDTRHTGQLLHHFGIHKPLLALHRHNEHAAADAVLRRLDAGERVAYASDAGSPAVSDPGAVLVAAVAAAGHRSVPIAGPSSVVAALSVAGDAASAAFRFAGFLPAKGSERAQAVQTAAGAPDTQVLFEAPHRIGALAAALAAACPGRTVTVCRELTKQFESVTTLPAAGLPGHFAGHADAQRGEFVLVLHALAAEADAPDPRAAEHDAALRTLLGVLPLRQAVDLVVALSGAARNAVYARALSLQRAADAVP